MTLRRLGLCAVLLAFPSLGGAQEPPKADASAPLVRATLSDVAWLIGNWEGSDSNGDSAVHSPF